VTHSLQGVHMRACMHSLFIVVGGQGLGGLSSLWRALVAWRRFLTEGEIGVLSVSFIFFDAVESKCGCMCVYTYTRCIRGTRM